MDIHKCDGNCNHGDEMRDVHLLGTAYCKCCTTRVYVAQFLGHTIFVGAEEDQPTITAGTGSVRDVMMAVTLSVNGTHRFVGGDYRGMFDQPFLFQHVEDSTHPSDIGEVIPKLLRACHDLLSMDELSRGTGYTLIGSLTASEQWVANGEKAQAILDQNRREDECPTLLN
jgi:hypothetical protein